MNSKHCTFVLFPSNAAARASLGHINAEISKNPWSTRGAAHFATSLERKPSWTESDRREQWKKFVKCQH